MEATAVAMALSELPAGLTGDGVAEVAEAFGVELAELAELPPVVDHLGSVRESFDEYVTYTMADVPADTLRRYSDAVAFEMAHAAACAIVRFSSGRVSHPARSAAV